MDDNGCQTAVLAVEDIAAVVRRPPSSVVDDVFDCSGTPSSPDRGRRCHGLVVSLPPLSSRGDEPLDPNNDDDEDKDDDNDDDNRSRRESPPPPRQGRRS